MNAFPLTIVSLVDFDKKINSNENSKNQVHKNYVFY
jgi:hypothetical protein